MLIEMTKKTVPLDRLESIISPLIDTRIHAQGERVKGKKAAGEKKNRIIHTRLMTLSYPCRQEESTRTTKQEPDSTQLFICYP